MADGINYFGMLRSPVSWAKIGREIINSFINSGVDVCVYERRGFLYNPDFKLPEKFNLQKKFIHDKTLTFEYPENYKLITTKRKIGMLTYETTKVPEKWVKRINERLDVLFLPGQFNRKIFTESGVRSDLIKIVPYGINPKIFYKKDERKNNPKFTFLSICMPQKRKGIDVLAESFVKTFGSKSDVELMIKFPYKPGKSKYDVDLSKIPMSKNIKIITEEYDEGQMAELMRNADCFVLPSRAEGFGMIYLEAIACGIPVIATNWGGHCDFLNEQNSLLVKCKMTKAGEIQYDNAGGDGFMAEPDRDDLCDKILFAKNNITELMEKIKNIDLKRFYWDEITKEMQKYILTI